MTSINNDTPPVSLSSVDSINDAQFQAPPASLTSNGNGDTVAPYNQDIPPDSDKYMTTAVTNLVGEKVIKDMKDAQKAHAEDFKKDQLVQQELNSEHRKEDSRVHEAKIHEIQKETKLGG